MCRVTRRGQQAQDLQRGIADLETNPNTCRQDCHPEPHRGLHSSRQREQETWSQHSKEQQRRRSGVVLRSASATGGRGVLFTKCHVLYDTEKKKQSICQWVNRCHTWDKVRRRALTLRGQSSGVTRRRGQTESSRERLCRPGHHTYTVNVSGWELPPP